VARLTCAGYGSPVSHEHDGAADPVEVNRQWWDERAALHGQDGFFYDTEAFLRGERAITRRELDA
jgi:hypothetical protein